IRSWAPWTLTAKPPWSSCAASGAARHNVMNEHAAHHNPPTKSERVEDLTCRDILVVPCALPVLAKSRISFPPSWRFAATLDLNPVLPLSPDPCLAPNRIQRGSIP